MKPSSFWIGAWAFFFCFWGAEDIVLAWETVLIVVYLDLNPSFRLSRTLEKTNMKKKNVTKCDVGVRLLPW